MAIYYFLKKSSYLFLFILWGSSSFASATDIVDVDEKRQNFINPFGYSRESIALYNQALLCTHPNSLSRFESLLTESAKKGHLGAAYTLGNYYNLRLAEKEKALEWYEFAQDRGYPGMKEAINTLKFEMAVYSAEKKHEESQKKSKKIKHKIKLYKAQKENKTLREDLKNQKFDQKSSNDKFFEQIKPLS